MHERFMEISLYVIKRSIYEYLSLEYLTLYDTNNRFLHHVYGIKLYTTTYIQDRYDTKFLTSPGMEHTTSER